MAELTEYQLDYLSNFKERNSNLTISTERIFQTIKGSLSQLKEPINEKQFLSFYNNTYTIKNPDKKDHISIQQQQQDINQNAHDSIANKRDVNFNPVINDSKIPYIKLPESPNKQTYTDEEKVKIMHAVPSFPEKVDASHKSKKEDKSSSLMYERKVNKSNIKKIAAALFRGIKMLTTIAIVLFIIGSVIGHFNRIESRKEYAKNLLRYEVEKKGNVAILPLTKLGLISQDEPFHFDNVTLELPSTFTKTDVLDLKEGIYHVTFRTKSNNSFINFLWTNNTNINLNDFSKNQLELYRKEEYNYMFQNTSKIYETKFMSRPALAFNIISTFGARKMKGKVICFKLSGKTFSVVGIVDNANDSIDEYLQFIENSLEVTI